MYPNPGSLHKRATLILLIMLCQYPLLLAQVRYGNSYINVSKKNTGGTVQPGDTLEIRTNYYFPNGYSSDTIFFVRYLDNIPTNTTYVSDSIRLITNEGVTYKRWTNDADTDPGTYIAAPPVGHFNIRINIGRTATSPLNNTVSDLTGTSFLKTGGSGRDKPLINNGLLLTTTFRVRVTGAVGDTITLGAGEFRYKAHNNSSHTDSIITATRYKILITDNIPVCPDAVGRNFVAEAGGTFDSGATQNRSYGPTFLIPNYTYLPLTPSNQTGDGYYAIVNNLSPYQSTAVNSREIPFCTTAPAVVATDSCKNRMFNGHWEIIGDHTGSTTPAGNLPVAPGGSGGYMLVVNAAYATSEAYRQSITGLCPNTSYEFSLWVRNVCTNCAIDSNDVKTYYPGVYPNLTFAIDNLDRYSSGQIDTTGWMKKGFMFKTGPAQTSILISIRNNASGGGGNDWAIDDIALVTCNPNLVMDPGPSAVACYGQQVDISCIVRSYFDNYINWEWERSTDGGATWASTGETGTGTPVLNNGLYEYTALYPSFLGDSAAHGDRYRIKVASSTANLTNTDCSFNANTMVTVMINNCQWVLSTKLLSLTGQLLNSYTNLRWVTENEAAHTIFDIERSNDGIHFSKIGTVNARGVPDMGAAYNFNDPVAVTGTAYYRLKTIEKSNYSYSRIVMVSNRSAFDILSLVNPFTNQLTFSIASSEKGMAFITLTDAYGRLVKQSRENIINGLNTVNLHGLDALSKGTYTLHVQLKDKIINKQVLKLNRE